MTKMLAVQLESVRDHLPPKIRWLDLDGQIVFPHYGSDGALKATMVSYLVRTGDGEQPERFMRDLPNEEGVTDYGRGWKIGVLKIPAFAQANGFALAIAQQVENLLKEMKSNA